MKSARKEETIEKLQRLVMQDRRISVRMISKAVGISIGTVKTVLTEDLKLHKVCAKFVPKSPLTTRSSFVCTMSQVHTGDSWMADREMKVA